MTVLDPHHRKLRSQGGDDSWGNQIRLPRDIHDLIHANPDVAYEHGMLVREGDNPADIEPDLRRFLASVGYEGEPGILEQPEKPKRQRKQGEERRKRRKISVHVPDDHEDGGGIWDDTLERVKERLVQQGLYEHTEEIPVYEACIAAWQDWLDRFEETYA